MEKIDINEFIANRFGQGCDVEFKHLFRVTYWDEFDFSYEEYFKQLKDAKEFVKSTGVERPDYGIEEVYKFYAPDGAVITIRTIIKPEKDTILKIVG